ncbi:MAG TPA: sigma-70 family RNA polymerase sigma factor [Candidatus Dormibacteraeota bacterium]|jgi:RNA polymerase sigma-70 factor (ECF subfamily)
MSDELVRRSQHGDRAAYAELVGPLQEGLYNLALRSLGDPEDARDVVQESLLRAWVGLPALVDRQTFAGWLYRIAVHHCQNRARSRRRHPVASLDDNVVHLGADDPEGSVIRREQRRELADALLRVTTEIRLAVVLRDINGLSYAEIADALQVPVGTVRSRLSRGRAELRRHLTAASGTQAERPAR